MESFFAPSRNTFTVEGASRTVKSIRRDQSHTSLKQSQHSEESSQTHKENASLEEQEGERQIASDIKASENAALRRSLSRRCSQSTINIYSPPPDEQIHLMKESLTSAATPTSSLCELNESRVSSPSSQVSLRQQNLSISEPSLYPAKTIPPMRARSNREVVSKDKMSGLSKNSPDYINQKPVVKQGSDDETQIPVAEGQEMMKDMDEENARENDRRSEEIGNPKPETQKTFEDETTVETIEVDSQMAVPGACVQDLTVKHPGHASKQVGKVGSPIDEKMLLPTPRASTVSCGMEPQVSRQTSASHQCNLSWDGRDVAVGKDSPPENPKISSLVSCHPQLTSASSSSSPIVKRGVPQSLKPDKAYRDEIVSTAPQGEVTMRFDLSRLRKRFANAGNHQVGAQNRRVSQRLKQGDLEEAAGIKNKNSELAEETLSRVISKADFEKMEVKGQFNKGFIIARLQSDNGTDDLFIIDQHASDEKYNFETLQQTTKIKAQALIKCV